MRFSNDCSEGDALCSGLALLAGCLRPLTRRVAHHISLAVICCHNAATNAETAGTSAKHLTVGKIARYVRYLRNSATPYCLASPGSKYKVSTALFFCIFWQQTVQDQTIRDHTFQIRQLPVTRHFCHHRTENASTNCISTVSQRIEKTTEKRLKLALYAGVKSWCRGICKDSQVVITS